MTIALSNLAQTLLGLYATSKTSVLTVMSETDEARRSSDGVFIYKASQEEIKNTVPKQRRSLSAASGVNLVQNLGGHQGEARRAELRSKPRGPYMAERGRGSWEGNMPPPHQLGIMGGAR